MPSKKTERFQFRISPADREILQRASQLVESGDTAEMVRLSSLFVAHILLDMDAGKFNLSYTALRLVMLLSQLIDNPAWKKVLPEKLEEFSQQYPAAWNEDIYGGEGNGE